MESAQPTQHVTPHTSHTHAGPCATHAFPISNFLFYFILFHFIYFISFPVPTISSFQCSGKILMDWNFTQLHHHRLLCCAVLYVALTALLSLVHLHLTPTQALKATWLKQDKNINRTSKKLNSQITYIYSKWLQRKMLRWIYHHF